MARSLATKAGSRTLLAALPLAHCLALVLALAAAACLGGRHLGPAAEGLRRRATKPARSPASCRPRRANLPSAEEEAAAASAREQKLTTLLATGEEKAARLAAEVQRTKRRLAAEKTAPAPSPGRPCRAPRRDLRERLAQHRQHHPRLRQLRRTGDPDRIPGANPAVRLRPGQPRGPGPPHRRRRARARRRPQGPGRHLQRTPRRRPLRSRRGSRKRRGGRIAPALRRRRPLRRAGDASRQRSAAGSTTSRPPRPPKPNESAPPKPKAKSNAGWAAPTRSPPTSSCASPAATTAPSTPRAAPAAPTKSSRPPGSSTAARANLRTLRRPNRTGSPPKSGPTPAPAPGSAARAAIPGGVERLVLFRDYGSGVSHPRSSKKLSGTPPGIAALAEYHGRCAEDAQNRPAPSEVIGMIDHRS